MALPRLNLEMKRSENLMCRQCDFAFDVVLFFSRGLLEQIPIFSLFSLWQLLTQATLSVKFTCVVASSRGALIAGASVK